MPEWEPVWTPVVAEREGPTSAPTAASFPCRGEFNRYLGCVGARRCRGMGVKMCVLGRWPDERQSSSRLNRGLVEASTTPLRREAVPLERLRPATPKATPAQRSQNASEGPSASQRPLVGIVQVDRRTWQQLSRQVTSAGYEPVWFPSVETACSALEGDQPPAALLADGTLMNEGGAGETLLGVAEQHEVPVLSLPPSGRDHPEMEAAARMAVVWLTITLRKRAPRLVS